MGAWGIPERPGRSEERGGSWSREKRSFRPARDVPGQMAETRPSGWTRMKHPDLVIPKRLPSWELGSRRTGRVVPVFVINS